MNNSAKALLGLLAGVTLMIYGGLIGRSLSSAKIEKVVQDQEKNIEYIIAGTSHSKYQDVFFPQQDGSYKKTNLREEKIGNREMKYFLDPHGQAYVFNGKDYVPATKDLSDLLSKDF